jgi:ADP-ribose pyrophosphatase
MVSESRNYKTLNPWVTLVETEIRGDSKPYIHIKVPDYVFVLCITDEGLIPLVRQFRMPLGRETLELPAGLIENDQTPIDAAIKELDEETGVTKFRAVIAMPQMILDSGRIDNKTFGFVVLGAELPTEADARLAELKTVWVSRERLISLAMSGEIDHMGQVALILWASHQGHLRD